MNYITIQDFMVSELGLKGNELIVFALIYGFSQNGQSYFYGSLNYIQERTGLSRPTVIDLINKLIDKKYITKQKIYSDNGVASCIYYASKETLLGVVNFLNQGSKETLLGGGKEILPNNKIYNNKEYIGEEVKNTVTQIILYLNEKANKNYKVEAKCHRTPIQARLNDGYTIKDFKKVIDTKVEDWLNTDMNEYLVPETLFRPTNMEKYLNKANKNKEHEVEVTW